MSTHKIIFLGENLDLECPVMLGMCTISAWRTHARENAARHEFEK